ncbi:MAG: hypothetical protein ACOYOK_09900, partial [Pseudobdellovibrionaceae bacterium]
MVYSCQIDIIKVAGLPDDALTVGREFFYVCKSEVVADKSLQADKVQLLGLDKDPYALRLLSFEWRSLYEMDLKLVSYRPGPVQIPEITLSDGTNTLTVPGPQINIASVIQQPKNGEPTKPFGPYGPVSLTVPIEVWIIGAAVIFLFLL